MNLKTKLNDSSVTAFLESIPDEKRRSDSFQILDLMQKVTGEEPKMWGASIVGFGIYHYRYASGRKVIGCWLDSHHGNKICLSISCPVLIISRA